VPAVWDANEEGGRTSVTASPADGPTRHPRVAPWRACGVGGERPASGAGQKIQEDLMATTVHETGRRIALGEIRVPENVRSLDDAHVQALAGSIALQGMLVPLVVRGDGDGFELVAGFHRIAAARSLGLADVPVVVRDVETEDADRAVENITSCRRRHDVIYADRMVMPTSG
jgi:ParB-like nuclease domain